ncbi:MAG: penicillin-binding protein 2 [bacterium]|nr:penicillin-binding protein 2 [bacterium]
MIRSIRINLLFLFFCLFFAAIVARLFFWQIIKGGELAAEAKNQYKLGRTVSAPRGNIYSSDGSFLAARVDSWLVYASLPDMAKPIPYVADKLAPFFLEEPYERNELLLEIDRLKSILDRKEVVWVPLEHKVATDTKNNIESLEIKGIGFEKEESRYYPEASAAAQLLGFVGKDPNGDDIGYFGLEGYYNLSLSGKSGFLSRESDAKGIPILLGDYTEVSAVRGVDLITYLDKSIQMSVETKLKEAIERYGAKAGTVIVADPKTGAIFAMASLPSYDPLKYFDYGNELFKNPAISDTFEPGSIFKVLVMASALDAKVVKPDTKCDICSGPLRVDKYTIETWNNEYFPDSTMAEVIVHSDNVGMVFVGQKLGDEKMYEYLDKFGIGKETGIDLQGEVAVPLRKKGTWNIVDLSTASFGQGVAVTPIEMIRAVSVLANGGIMPTPQVVDKLSGDNWEEDIKPKTKKVISEEAVNEVTAMMVEAAKSGESKWINAKGFKVAGKTGTAQIPISGHYDADKTIASFIGFAPAGNAKFIMLVTLKEPSSSPWASETAAPLWYSIAKDLFLYFGIQPEN